MATEPGFSILANLNAFRMIVGTVSESMICVLHLVAGSNILTMSKYWCDS